MDDQNQFIRHTSCEACGSSDANALYEGGSTYCFGCQAYGKPEQEDEDMEEAFKAVAPFKMPEHTKGFRERGLTTKVCEFYGVKCQMIGDVITEHYYPYYKDGELVGAKVRRVADKQFSAVGNKRQAELFGMSKFNPGGRKLCITEGELDTLAVAQAFIDKHKTVYPVVSLPDGAGSASKALLQHREWIRSFDEVVLMFDNDVPGQEATQVAAKIIGADKVRIATFAGKDPSDEYLTGGVGAIMNAVWNAQPWQPAGIINASETWETYQNEKSAVYQTFPAFLPMLNEKIHGVREGSITMLTSGTGCGKTTFVKEFIYNILQTTEDQIGLVSLEESTAETVRGFISLDLSKRVGLPGVDVSLEHEKAAFDRTLGTGRVLMLDHQGSCEDSSLMDKMEFLAVSGCKYIVLDHITIAVSETADGNTNSAIDALMSSLLKMTKRHNTHVTCISHLRKVGGGAKSFEAGGDIQMDDLRGSGSLKQISAQVIALSRDLGAENEQARNTVRVKVLKDRFTGYTGPCGCYTFDHDTGRLNAAEDVSLDGFSATTMEA